MTPQTLRKQLCFLRERYEIVSMDETIQAISSGSGIERPSCVITFDDGWHDNYLYAFPVLRELSIPATIFVATEHIETGEDFWPERLTRILLTMDHTKKETRATLENLFPSVVSHYNSRCREELMNYANHVIISMKDNPLKKIRSTLSQLQNPGAIREPSGEDGRRVCSWTELRTMADSGIVTIGSHTKSHVILTNETMERCKEEIFESKRMAEERLGHPVRHFSYPNGNFNLSIEELVKEAGYKSASTCLNGVNNKSTSPYRIRRIHVCDPRTVDGKDYADFRFALEISGGLQKLKSLRNSISSRPY